MDFTIAYVHEPAMYAATIDAPEFQDSRGQCAHGKSTGSAMNKFWGDKSSGHDNDEAHFRYLKGHGYTATDADPFLARQAIGAHHIFVEITVEDFHVGASIQSLIEPFHTMLYIKYIVKRFGRRLSEFLGWSVSYTDNGANFLNQPSLAQTTVESAGFVETNGRQTPYNSTMELTAPQENDKIIMETKFKYATVLEDLLYLADRSRPNLAYIIGKPATALQNPTVRH